MFLEIGSEGDHTHLLVQSVPTYSLTSIVKKVKKQLWGGEFWSDGYFVSTVGEHANEEVIRQYIQNQEKEGKYRQLHKQKAGEMQQVLF